MREAVLWILNTGAQWHMLPQSYPYYKTVHHASGLVSRRDSAPDFDGCCPNDLRDRGVLDEECFIDATFVMAKGGGAEIRTHEARKRHENHGDRHGLPLSVSTHMQQTITKSAWCSSASTST